MPSSVLTATISSCKFIILLILYKIKQQKIMEAILGNSRAETHSYIPNTHTFTSTISNDLRRRQRRRRASGMKRYALVAIYTAS